MQTNQVRVGNDLYESPIHTLNARGHTMLEFMRAEFKLSDQVYASRDTGTAS